MDPTQPTQQQPDGIAVVTVEAIKSPTPQPAPSKQEAEDVKRWFERIKRARKHDDEARKQYAKDRRYARGDTNSEVAANLIGTYIDIMESFLYARDPDVDIRPARAVEPPSLEAMRDAAEDHVDELPDVQMVQQQVIEAVTRDSGDAMQGVQAGTQAAEAYRAQLVNKKFREIRRTFQRRQRDNKAFADTLEIIVSRMWQDARLKKRGMRWVRSALTVGVGVIKSMWEERTAPSPETVTQINDLQSMIQNVAASRSDMDDLTGADLDAATADYKRQISTLQAKAEQVVARGFVIDGVSAEDIQIAPGFAVSDYLDAPWISHRIPMQCSEARARFALTKDQMGKATKYAARKPVMRSEEAALIADNITAKDADQFVEPGKSTDVDGDNVGGYGSDAGGEWVMVEEIWDATSGTVLTGIHGVTGWVKPAWKPQATTRFYPFFIYCLSDVDGQRHPQSLVSRSAKLIDEYNRIGSAEAEHRRRVLPGILVNGGQVGADQLGKVVSSAVGEYTVIQTTTPDINLNQVFWAKQYPQIDQTLYDRTRIINELERIWGIQEALSGAINSAKTATEAQIQQTGFNARTTGRRDTMESQLQEMAQYTAEIARANVTLEDAQAMAGPDAMWPEYTDADDLGSMVAVDIRAGSSGKPDTALERQAWAQQLPLLQAGVVQIGQLRGSSPDDIADALEALLKITAQRAGDRIDIDALLPQSGEQPQTPPAAPNGAPGGQPMPGVPGQPPETPLPPSPFAPVVASITPQAL